jgi:nitronate monooxygenase
MSSKVCAFMPSLALRQPIIQAPMAGGATTPELVAAVSNSGALGMLAAALLDPDAILRKAEQIRQLSSRPFGINLFVLPSPFPAPDPSRVVQALAWLAPRYAELEIAAPDVHAPDWRWCPDFQQQLDATIAVAPAVASFTFGILERSQVKRLHAVGTRVVGTATTLAEAQAWQAVGADAVVAQGYEAGGHRGHFLAPLEHSLIGTLALVRSCAQALRIPVIAAGGLMDGAGIAAVLTLGAQAAQLGTAFLVCDECRIAPAHRAALLAARGKPAHTGLTRLFSGRHARGIVNDYMRQLQPLEGLVPSYPIFNALTAPLRHAAAAADDDQQLALWAGQGVSQVRPMPAAQLVQLLAEELHQAQTQAAAAPA